MTRAQYVSETDRLTHWRFQVHTTKVAFEQQAILQAVVSTPGPHAVISGHSTHSMLSSLVPAI